MIGYAAQGSPPLLHICFAVERDVIDIFRFYWELLLFVKSLTESGLTSPQDSELQRVYDFIM